MVVSSQEKEQEVVVFPATSRIASPGKRSIPPGQTLKLSQQLITPNFVLYIKRVQPFPFPGELQFIHIYASGCTLAWGHSSSRTLD